MTRSKEYNFILTWLRTEPNVDLVVPYIQEITGRIKPVKEVKSDIQKREVDYLRKRVVMIKQQGHEEYSSATIQAILDAQEVFGEGVRVLD